jgi:SAM-dependent methyltransferase
MLAWHELVDRDHDLQNPTSPAKIRRVGSYLRLSRDTRVLDIACGTGGPALVLAREFGCHIDGLDVSTVFVDNARQRISDAGLLDLISVDVGDAAQAAFEPGVYDVALCLGAAFVWGHIGDAAVALAHQLGGGRAIAVGEPFWRDSGRDEDGLVDLSQTVERFEAGGAVDLIGMVAASEDDWDLYYSVQWRAAIEAGGAEVIERHLSGRERYLRARRSEVGWAIFAGRVR